MAVTCYRSSDASAPTLTGVVGSLTTLLDAVLVNGYGSQPAAGWTIAFTGTNQRVYTQGTGSSGLSLYVNDTAISTAQEALVTGFEVASALGTGTGQFPLTAQNNLGGTAGGALRWRKSTTASATVRNWTIVADATCLYLFVETGDLGSPQSAYGFFFGDIFAYKASDPYRALLIGGTSNNSNGGDNFHSMVANPTATLAGHYMPRTWTGGGTSIAAGKIQFGISNGNNAALGHPNSANFVYPNGPDGGLYMSPVWIVHNSAMRGYMKGLWSPQQDEPLNHNDVLTGSGAQSGKTFLCQNIQAGGSLNGQALIEISNTWG